MPPPTQTSIPRAWWLRRILAATLIALALLLAMRLIAGLIVDRQWARQVERLERDGISLRPESLQPPAVADAANAALVWEQAFAAMSRTVDSPRESNFESDQLGRYPPYLPQWHTLADASARADGPAFALAEQAAQLPACDWGTVFRTPLMNVLTSARYSPMRALGNKLADAAEREFLRDRHDLALRHVSSLLALGRHARIEPLLVSHLVAAGLDSSACRSLRSHVGSIRIGSAAGAASVAQVRSLIAALIDPDDERSMARAAQGDVTFTADIHDGFASRGWLIRPTLEREKLRFVDGMHRIALAVEAPRGAQRERLLAPLAELEGDASFRRPASPMPRFSRPVLYFVYGGGGVSSRLIDVHEARMVDRRVAAIALAVRWFQADRGRVPGTLEELVPTYLPRIPPNALSPTGRPFEYVVLPRALPDGGDRPMLFIDRGLPRGDPPELPQYEMHLPIRMPERHQWADLTSWRPTDEQLEEPQ